MDEVDRLVATLPGTLCYLYPSPYYHFVLTPHSITFHPQPIYLIGISLANPHSLDDIVKINCLIQSAGNSGWSVFPCNKIIFMSILARSCLLAIASYSYNILVFFTATLFLFAALAIILLYIYAKLFFLYYMPFSCFKMAIFGSEL